MLAKYSHPASSGWTGEAAVPVPGLATDWLALVMACWGGKVSAVAPGAVARSYVDDLVAYGRNRAPSTLADVLGGHGAFWRSLWVCLAHTRPSLSVVKAELRLVPSPPVGVALKDLGLDQYFAAAAPTYALERGSPAPKSIQRLSRLAVPWACPWACRGP